MVISSYRGLSRYGRYERMSRRLGADLAPAELIGAGDGVPSIEVSTPNTADVGSSQISVIESGGGSIAPSAPSTGTVYVQQPGSSWISGAGQILQTLYPSTGPYRPPMPMPQQGLSIATVGGFLVLAGLGYLYLKKPPRQARQAPQAAVAGYRRRR